MCFCLPILKRALAAALAVLAWLALALPALADELSDFNTAMEAAMSHRRVATGYLRTGNIDLATLEIEAMRETWAHLSSLPRPAAFADGKRYTAVMLESAAGLIGTKLVLDMGRPDVAAEALDKIRKAVSDLRRENHITLLADCVLDASVSMDALFALDGKTDWESVTAGADSYRGTLERCDGMAGERVRRDGEFRRLIDGAIASLAQIPEAAETRDADLLHRLLIELRSFDNLLAFRFG